MPQFTALAVNHRLVITRWRLVIAEHLQWGEELFVNKTVLSPVSSFTLLCMAAVCLQ
ncbi:unnamed protein product [Staurois parvus]|uniref:Uncharacterized protein n=1 Tax=Staurois parvus TaxID=386267 RepID=A0ABN9GCY9_9NEOB|nr:unnamed protein product [Staurois parvus]